MNNTINVGWINETKGLALAVTTVKGHKKPCLVIQRNNTFDVVATFTNEIAADRFANTFKDFIGG